MINNKDEIVETIRMIEEENLDVRIITMGISLIDCIDTDINKSCEKVYNKIYKYAKDLVKVGETISKKYGIPIVNKRVSVTPISMLVGVSGGDPVLYAKTLDKVAKDIGVNFIGGYSALVQKGFAPGDMELINSIPRALNETDYVCSSVNIGSTRAGINLDAVKIMGEKVREAADLSKDRECIAASKMVVFCNAVEDNPFMAGAFHGVGEADCVINVGVSGPGVVRAALAKTPKDASIAEVADIIKKLNAIGGKHGIGIVDIVENRVVGMKSRGVYETPGGTILVEAHQQLEELVLDRDTIALKKDLGNKMAGIVYEGKWFTPIREAITAFTTVTQQYVTGEVKLRLYKGNIIKNGTTSPYSLYSESLASFTTGDMYDHHDAEGFITLWGLPLKVRAMRMNELKKDNTK